MGSECVWLFGYRRALLACLLSRVHVHAQYTVLMVLDCICSFWAFGYVDAQQCAIDLVIGIDFFDYANSDVIELRNKWNITAKA